jgi:ectoine hydroxylase-related dioxygenase (phytanoyl-CoA dioxygenase family)
LCVAETINGEDFSPFNEVLFIKDPGLGAAVSWHQDGDTHWDNPEFDEGIHGFNFMAQVYGSSPVNGVWTVPGTHKLGKIDIKAMVEDAGSERLRDAVPLVCEAGDVVICNRQLVHGSFANAGFEPRLTINFGFHRRSSVLNVKGAGIHSPSQIYTDKIIEERSKVIGYAIDARSQKYPHEKPFVYKPFSGSNNSFVWCDRTKDEIKDYNLLDLSI